VAASVGSPSAKRVNVSIRGDHESRTRRHRKAVAPTVVRSPRFSLKGGRALNLFVQDMPRLSIDIDIDIDIDIVAIIC